MRLLLSGASGFVGAPLFRHLLSQGHQVVRLVRSTPTSSQEIQWDPERGRVVKEALEGFDGVIHLAGEPLSLKRWTKEKKEKILYSRSVSTWFLSQLLASLYHPPKVFISASAVGYYGDRGEEILEEEAKPGCNFLATVCKEWEKASSAIEERGTRTIRARFGIVLGPHGGALQKMLLPYRLGLGAVLGSGKQWISWIALQDLLSLFDHLLLSDLEGPVNAVAPLPIRQREFADTLAQALSRPRFLKIPGWMLRLALGETADNMLLASTRVLPRKLLDAGYTFRCPSLAEALTSILTS